MKISLVRVIEFKEHKSFHPRDIIPSFELLSIASLLKKDKHLVEYLDNEILCLNSEDFEKLLLEKNSDVYIFHFQPIAAKAISVIIKNIKTKTKKSITIALGPTIEHQTQEFLKESNVDFAILGEAELTTQELVKKLSSAIFLKLNSKKKVRGLAFLHNQKLVRNKTRPLLKPDELPYLAHELIQNAKYKVVSKIVRPKKKIKWGFLLSSRGCPFNCVFCAPSIRNSFGKKYRFQSPKRTVDEMEYMIKKFKITAISFEDDLFTLNKKRVKSICREIVKRHLEISWTAATRLDCLDLRSLYLMKKAGCQGISVGVESGSDRILKLINKGEKISDIVKGINKLHKIGIAPTINLILGHPTETMAELQSTLAIVKKTKPAFVHLHYLTPYPGTIFFEKYRKKFRDFQDFSHWQVHNFNVSAVDTKTLKKMMSKIYFSYYFNPAYLKTYFKYRWNYWIYDPFFEISLLLKTCIFFFLDKKSNG